jgi:hypothetical protein
VVTQHGCADLRALGVQQCGGSALLFKAHLFGQGCKSSAAVEQYNLRLEANAMPLTLCTSLCARFMLD